MTQGGLTHYLWLTAMLINPAVRDEADHRGAARRGRGRSATRTPSTKEGRYPLTPSRASSCGRRSTSPRGAGALGITAMAEALGG